MKRDRFASDYDKVRRQAGMPRREPREGPETTADRVEDMNDDFQERMSARTQAEMEAAQRRAAEATALTLRANDTLRLRQFAAAGVEPPPGFISTLSLLLSIGWTIEEVDGRKVLVKPRAPAPAKRNRKTREEYAEESLKESF